jgi:peptidoglycan/LPS O-acetylase OafA/YrhL
VTDVEIRKLNMLRGLAALIVVISHFSNSTKWLGTYLGEGAGQLGVMLFFMLSGFLMSYLYLERDCNRFQIFKYIVARLSRVIPLFLLVVCGSFLVRFYGGEWLYDVESIQVLISHLLFIKGESVLWTIGPEIQFYMIFIFLWWIFAKHEIYLFMLIAIVYMLLFSFDFPRPKGDFFGLPFDISLLRGLPYFFSGLIVGHLYTRFGQPLRFQSGLFVFILLLILILYPKIYLLFFEFRHRMWREFSVLIVMATVFSSVLFLVPDTNSFMANSIGDFLGKISYSMYLLHLPVLWQIEKLLIESIEVKLIIFIIATLFVSYVSYRFIELPSARYLRKFVSHK